jgi:hypothetical protein
MDRMASVGCPIIVAKVASLCCSLKFRGSADGNATALDGFASSGGLDTVGILGKDDCASLDRNGIFLAGLFSRCRRPPE